MGDGIEDRSASWLGLSNLSEPSPPCKTQTAQIPDTRRPESATLRDVRGRLIKLQGVPEKPGYVLGELK